MNYVTTNIRIPEQDYLRLKQEAAKSRKSLAGVIREKLKISQNKRSDAEVAEMMKDLNKLAKKNSKTLKGWDSLAALREIRYAGKW